jgi:pimeloyl-ACP methyl ester carboxylesterase
MTAPSPTNYTLDLPQGSIRYSDCGKGNTLLFIHGLLVSGDLWRKVVPQLSANYRCIVPDLPLGAHRQPMPPEADLSPLGLAQLIVDFMTALDLQDVTLVGNDTGGGLCQLVAANHPQRLARLVLTNCDAFENFPPPLLRPLFYAAHIPGFVFLIAQLLRTPFAHNLLFSTVAHRSLSTEMAKCYFGPLAACSAVRRDVAKVICGISNRYTLEAARLFADFHKPVLLVWGEDDFFFPMREAERLQRAFPYARLERVADSKTFVAEDQPDILARSLKQFVHESISPAPSTSS